MAVSVHATAAYVKPGGNMLVMTGTSRRAAGNWPREAQFRPVQRSSICRVAERV